MNQLTPERRAQVISALVEGNSLRAVARMTGTHRTAIQKLLVELGAACSAYHVRTA
jgi:transposase